MQTSCYDQTEAEVTAWLKANVEIGSRVVVRHTQGGFLQYVEATVVRLGLGRFQVDSLGQRDLSPAGTSFYYSGKNCWHPTGQTRLVIPTAAVLETNRKSGDPNLQYAETSI